MRRSQETQEQLNALLELFAEEGASPSGDAPRESDIRSVLGSRDYGEAGETVRQFRSSTLSKEPVRRDRVGSTTKQAFADARSAGDTQAQIDVLYRILTGETIGE